MSTTTEKPAGVKTADGREFVRASAGKVMAGDAIWHEGRWRDVEQVDPSSSGITIRIRFAHDGEAKSDHWSPRASTAVKLALNPTRPLEQRGNGQGAGAGELEDRMRAGLTGKAAEEAKAGKNLKQQQEEEVKAARKAASSTRASGPREGSMTDAMVTVLKRAKGPLTAREITERITKGPNPLAPGLKGKTPHQTVAAKLATEHKAGGLFERVDRGQYTLRAKA